MATGKTARSRGTAASAKENGPKLEEGLNPFKSDKFDAEGYVQSKCSLSDKVNLPFHLPILLSPMHMQNFLCPFFFLGTIRN